MAPSFGQFVEECPSKWLCTLLKPSRSRYSSRQVAHTPADTFNTARNDPMQTQPRCVSERFPHGTPPNSGAVTTMRFLFCVPMPHSGSALHGQDHRGSICSWNPVCGGAAVGIAVRPSAPVGKDTINRTALLVAGLGLVEGSSRLSINSARALMLRTPMMQLHGRLATA